MVMRVLSVAAVRRHLYRPSDDAAAGDGHAGPTALLGQLFHDLYGALTGTDVEKNLAAPLELADAAAAAWRQALIDHAFAAVIAPGLARHEGALQTQGAAVLDFWAAAQELCGWLAGVMHEQRAVDATRSLEAVRRQVFGAAEAALEIDVTDATWPEPVRLQGRADAAWIRCADAARSLVAVKFGRTPPDADLLQTCLHDWMLTEGQPAAPDSALALIAFEPQRHERVFAGATLRAARPGLKAVIAHLVGFSGDAGHSVAVAQTAAAAAVPVPRPAAASVPPPAAAPVPPPAAVPVPQPASAAANRFEALRFALIKAFAERGVALTLAEEAQSGPVVVRFYATASRGTSATRLARLAEGVGKSLGSRRAPQLAVRHGRLTIDVERPDPQPAHFADWRLRLPTSTPLGSSRFAVGVGVDGELDIADLADSQSPHLLVVGSQGSGKSEWVRAFLASLMAGNSPATLRLALIDPPPATLSVLRHSPFLWRPVADDAAAALALIEQLTEEMAKRLSLLHDAGADDLTAFNRTGAAALAWPRIVCVGEEFAGLMVDPERRAAMLDRVSRIGVAGRATGIHLVFTTRGGGRDALSDAIDASLPARVAFATAHKANSRLVLGEAGAESLLGRGDLLYKDIGAPRRLQGLLASDAELATLGQAAN
jgi:hypothetical protein